MRTLLLITCRACLTISLIATIYLLFIFGHTEVAPPRRVATLAAIAVICAVVGGILQWAGLPSSPKDAPQTKTRKK